MRAAQTQRTWRDSGKARAGPLFQSDGLCDLPAVVGVDRHVCVLAACDAVEFAPADFLLAPVGVFLIVFYNVLGFKCLFFAAYFADFGANLKDAVKFAVGYAAFHEFRRLCSQFL